MFKNLCLLLVFVLCLGNVLRLTELKNFNLLFWCSLLLSALCFFWAFYHSLKVYHDFSKTRKPRLSELKKDAD